MDRGRLQVGRMGKRGQIFSGILVLITLAMCMLSIGIYLKQQGAVQSSLVSPLAVLEIRDAKDIFEMREEELIKKSLENVQSEFGTDEFLGEFREEFISGISEEMKEFIFSNLTWKGKILESGTFDKDVFLENVVYSEGLSQIDSSKMVFGRGKIGKVFELRALDTTKSNFAVVFNLNFEDKYLITKEDGEYKVEAMK